MRVPVFSFSQKTYLRYVSKPYLLVQVDIRAAHFLNHYLYDNEYRKSNLDEIKIRPWSVTVEISRFARAIYLAAAFFFFSTAIVVLSRVKYRREIMAYFIIFRYASVP